MVWNSLNNKVYCANEVSDDVTVIDGANDTVITTIEVGSGPWAFCWNSIQNRVYVANYRSSSISVIRDVTGIQEDQQPVSSGSRPLEIYPNPANSFLALRFQKTADRSILKIYDISGKVIKEIPLWGSGHNENEVRVSLKGVNPGIYFLRFGKETKKFLVVR